MYKKEILGLGFFVDDIMIGVCFEFFWWCNQLIQWADFVA